VNNSFTLSAEQIRQRYVDFVLRHRRKSTVSVGRIVVGTLLCFTGVLIPLGLFLIYRGLRAQTPLPQVLEDELEFVERAQPVMAYPLMVNRMLRRPGDQAAPGLFLISFDPGPPKTVEFMADTVLKVLDPSEAQLPQEEANWLTQLMLDEDYEPSRRRKLPPAVSRGHAIYACDPDHT
jgi:hypothetical protein